MLVIQLSCAGGKRILLLKLYLEALLQNLSKFGDILVSNSA